MLQHVPICCSVLPVPEPIPLPRIDSGLSRIYIYEVRVNQRVTLRSGSKLRDIYEWLMSHTPQSHVWVMPHTAHKWRKSCQMNKQVTSTNKSGCLLAQVTCLLVRQVTSHQQTSHAREGVLNKGVTRIMSWSERMYVGHILMCTYSCDAKTRVLKKYSCVS